MEKFKEKVMLSVDLLHPNTWNPNAQTDATFNQLVEEINTDGFDHPLNVCSCKCKLIDGDHYVIIGGEHRYRAVKVLGWTEVPCVIYEDWDETQQKLKTVRRNMLTGELDAKKFTALVKSLEEVVDRTQMPQLMGFDSEKEFERYLIREKELKESSFFDGLLDEARKEKFAVDSISDIVANIFASCGETADQDYLFFTYKGAMVAVVLCDDVCRKHVTLTHEYLRRSGDTMTQFMAKALETHLKNVGAIV